MGSGKPFSLAIDSLMCRKGGSRGGQKRLEQKSQSPGLREVLLLPDKEEFPLGKLEIGTTSGQRIHSCLS